MTNETAKINMVKQQLRTGDVLNETVLALYDKIPRHMFVPSAWQEFAYSDLQIPLTHEQRMMTPLEEGKLIQSLALTGKETVLEIGTGTGFLTALLSQQSKKVISIDYYPEFTTTAQEKLKAYGCDNVTCITADASSGWFEQAPYDVIVISGVVETLKKDFYLQLNKLGKLFVIMGKGPLVNAQLHQQNANDKWEVRYLFETNLPELIDKTIIKPFVF